MVLEPILVRFVGPIMSLAIGLLSDHQKYLVLCMRSLCLDVRACVGDPSSTRDKTNLKYKSEDNLQLTNQFCEVKLSLNSLLNKKYLG